MAGKLTTAQARFLALMAAEPAPSIFAWKSKVDGKIVDPIGGAHNWTHFRITTRVQNEFGQVMGRKTATVTEGELKALKDAGLVAACCITASGRRALEQSKE